MTTPEVNTISRGGSRLSVHPESAEKVVALCPHHATGDAGGDHRDDTRRRPDAGNRDRRTFRGIRLGRSSRSASDRLCRPVLPDLPMIG